MGSSLDGYVVTSVEDVQAAVNSCVESGQAIAPVGGGVRIHVGNEPTKDVTPLSTSRLTKIIDYNPEDLVVVAESGLTLSALQLELAKAGQWLPVEVAAPDRQTLGGIVASRANSLLRSGYGSVRDWLVGVELVDAHAQVVVGGGKVVKNVAGYDLPKLYCGSWGTLGILTKTNFKVSPLPESDRSLLVILSYDRNAEELLDRVLAKVNPASAILFNPRAAVRILGPEASPSQYLFVRFLGIREDVDLLIERTVQLAAPFAASVIDLPPNLAKTLAGQLTDFCLLEAPLCATYHILSSQVGAHARMIDWIASRFGLAAEVVADTATGIVSAHFYPLDVEIDWLQFLPLFKDKADRVGGSLIVERMPVSWRMEGFPVWSPVLPDFKIMQLIKQKLDSYNIFNPGRFMGGI